MNKLNIASLNIGNLTQRGKRQVLFNFVNCSKLDIIALQELAFGSCEFLEKDFDFIANIGPKTRGTGFLIRKGVGYSNVLYDPNGRILKLKVAGINLINVYAPSGRKKEAERRLFFHESLPQYTSWNKEPILLMGDFNSIQEERDRRTKNSYKSKVECKSLKNFINARGLRDVWRRLQGAEDGFTYFYKGGAARLDRFYSNPGVDNCVAKIFILPTAFTDHHCIALELNREVGVATVGRQSSGLWKMNTSILNDECFQAYFYEFWSRINLHALRSSDVTSWWENVFKPGLKKLAIRFCKYKAAERRERREALNKRLTEAINKTSRGEEGFDDFLKVKMEIMDWEKDVARGYKIRAGKVVDEVDEGLTTFHINSERERITSSKITQLEVDGRIVVEREGIEQGILQHFQTVFQREGDIDYSGREGFLKTVRGRVNIDGDSTDSPLTLCELKRTYENKER